MYNVIGACMAAVRLNSTPVIPCYDLFILVIILRYVRLNIKTKIKRVWII